MIETALWVLVCLSWVYWLAVWWSVRRFFRGRAAERGQEPEAGSQRSEARSQRSEVRGQRPGIRSQGSGVRHAAPASRAPQKSTDNGQRTADHSPLTTHHSPFTPPVSILKPVKGLDAGAYENFVSFCRQEYPDFEILFGVSDAADPAVDLVRRLQEEFPWQGIRLIVVPESGFNPKSCILHELSLEARNEVLVISDSDIRVTPDYLRRVVAPLQDPGVGLVTCPYRSVNPVTLTARLESLYLDVTFLPSAILAKTVLGTCFGMGATMVLRREDLIRTGGYGGIADHLADDYHIAHRIAGLGLKMVLSDYVVSNVLGWTSFRQQWDREVRWARSIRRLRPREYPGLLLTYSTPLAAVLLPVSGLSLPATGALLVSMLLRWLFALRMLDYLGHRETRCWLPWLPVRDGLSAVIWCCGVSGRHVTWRGTTFTLLRGDQLEPALVDAGAPRKIVTGAVRRLDSLLRRCQKIYEFSDHEECFLRVSLGQSQREVRLSDGTHVRPGERIGELHYWNERLPRIESGGPDLAWARAFQRGLVQSLRELARHIETDPRFAGVKAIRADLPLESRNGARVLERAGRAFGTETIEHERPTGLLRRLHEFGNYLLLWGLIWTFNPGSLKGKRKRPPRKRWEVWISREMLLSRFGSAAPVEPVAVELAENGDGRTRREFALQAEQPSAADTEAARSKRKRKRKKLAASSTPGSSGIP